MKQEEKDRLAQLIADDMAKGTIPNAEVMAKLIRGLCDEYKEEKREGRIPPCRAHDLEGNQ